MAEENLPYNPLILQHQTLPLSSLLYTLLDLSPGVEKKILKEILHFHLITYSSCPSTRTPAAWVMKFTILVITTIQSVCTPKVSPLGFRVMKFIITCLFTLQMLINKFWKDWPSTGSSREDVNNDGFQPIATGHLCDSDDLIKSENTLLPSHTKFNSYIHYF